MMNYSWETHRFLVTNVRLHMLWIYHWGVLLSDIIRFKICILLVLVVYIGVEYQLLLYLGSHNIALLLSKEAYKKEYLMKISA